MGLDVGDPTANSRLVLGDALDVLAEIPTGTVNLIYADPPFGTGTIRKQQRSRFGQAMGEQHAYRDDMPFDEYLEWLERVIVQMHRVLTVNGSVYLHLDWRATHHARHILDRVFGADRFLNEIIWAYDFGGRARDKWARKHDNILWYAKGPRWTFNRDAIDRLPYMAPNLVGPDKAELGKLPTDTWWMTVVPTNGTERTGYPTQKPLKLIERVIVASSNPGDLVADFFVGSGTTAVAAAKHGRDFLACDSNPEAIRIAEGRLAAVKASWTRLDLL